MIVCCCCAQAIIVINVDKVAILAAVLVKDFLISCVLLQVMRVLIVDQELKVVMAPTLAHLLLQLTFELVCTVGFKQDAAFLHDLTVLQSLVRRLTRLVLAE